MLSSDGFDPLFERWSWHLRRCRDRRSLLRSWHSVNAPSHGPILTIDGGPEQPLIQTEGSFARPFTPKLAPFTRPPAPHHLLCSCIPLRSLVGSLAHFAHSLARGKWMAFFLFCFFYSGPQCGFEFIFLQMYPFFALSTWFSCKRAEIRFRNWTWLTLWSCCRYPAKNRQSSAAGIEPGLRWLPMTTLTADSDSKSRGK